MNLPLKLQTEALKIKEYLEEMNKPKDIRNFVKTFEDACDILSIQPDFSNYFSNYSIAAEKLAIIYRVLNEGWKPNWSDLNQRKYYIWFKMSPYGFDVTRYGTWTTTSATGSRLFGKTDTITEYAGRQFADIHKDFMEI